MQSAMDDLRPSSIEFSRDQFFWLMAVSCQVLFWYLAVPGPQLTDSYVQSFHSGIQVCLWTVLFLFAIPLIYIWFDGVSTSQLGLGWGDWRFGFISLAVGGPPILLLVWAGTWFQPIRDFYPLVGELSGTQSWLIWFLCYGLFYIAFEFFYRGVLLQAPREWSVSTRITVAVSLCVLIHVGKPFLETLASVPASVLFAGLAWRTQSIWYGVLLHWMIGVVNDCGSAVSQ
jgi:hypothetical protein